MSQTQPFFPTLEWALAVISEPVTAIALKLGARVDEYHDDGLGPARATGFHLPSGMPVSFVEHTARLDLGTAIYVDASHFSSEGCEPFLENILITIACSRNLVTWVQDPSQRDRASRMAASAVEWHRAREARTRLPAMPDTT